MGRNSSTGKNRPEDGIRIKYTPIYIGFISVVISMALLAASTYAWFTDNAQAKGSRIGAGNLFIELLADKEYLNKLGYDDEKISGFGFQTYTREEKKEPGNETKTYYIITGSKVPVITLNKMEPGQVYPVKFHILNAGDLAVKYSAAFRTQVDTDGNELSFTGLETLERERAESEKYIKDTDKVEFSFAADTEYSYDEELANKGYLTHKEYDKMKEILEKKQVARDPKTLKPLEDYDLEDETQNLGGRLEDILDVYVGASEADIKPENYIGKLCDIKDGKLGAFGGYSLPLSEVAGEDGIVVPKDVTIYDADGEVSRTVTGVTEIGTLNYLIKMPEEADSKYEYSSLTFSLGATATQVEYEKDGINSMIYDADTRTDGKFDVKFDVQGKGEAPATLRVLPDSVIEKPDDPVAEGYEFGGWYKDKECETQWDFENDKVTGPTTLYANWVSPGEGG